MNFAQFFFKIRDETGEHEEELIDFQVVVKQKKKRIMIEQTVKDVTVDREQKKVFIWVD